jgi:hypothetical protein
MLDQDAQQQWSELYRLALLESDEHKLLRRIERAENAIQQRARQLWYSDSSPTRERQDLDVALRFLGLLRTVVLNNDTGRSVMRMVA